MSKPVPGPISTIEKGRVIVSNIFTTGFSRNGRAALRAEAVCIFTIHLFAAVRSGEYTSKDDVYVQTINRIAIDENISALMPGLFEAYRAVMIIKGGSEYKGVNLEREKLKDAFRKCAHRLFNLLAQ